MNLVTLEPLRTLYPQPASRSVMASMGEMLKDQIGGDVPTETQAEMLVRYGHDL